MLIYYILFFLIGTVLASFINATLYRIEKNYKYPEIFVKSSHCESCNHKLSSLDLFPILGFLVTGGRCRYCKEKINILYPLSEFFLGISFFLFYAYQTPWYYFAILLFLFVLAIYDVKEMGIPKTLTHVFLGICAVLFIFFVFNIENLFVPITVVFFLFVLNIFKKSFGVGDILVILGVGILLSGTQMIMMFWIAIVLALLYSISVIIIKKSKLKGMKIPLIPFISMAFVITLTFGDVIWNSLLKFMGM